MTAPTAPAISVCVPLYNKERYIADTIRSVLAQTFTNFELIVLDNASTDRSWAIARSFAGDPRVVLRGNPHTVPAPENFGRVVALSRAKLVKVLCADDLIHPGCLHRQFEVMQSDRTLAMTVCRHHVVDEAGRLLTADRGLRSPDLVGTQNRGTVLRRVVRHGGNPIGSPLDVLFRRAAFDAAGGFGPDPFFALDLGTWLRLLRHGGYHGLPETLASFRVCAGSASSAMNRRALIAQRRFIAELRHDNRDALRLRDLVFGAARAPLTWARHQVLFAAAEPAGPRRQVALRIMSTMDRGARTQSG